MPTRIAINGFGRIGRLAARRVLQDPSFELVAINDLADNEALAYLFKYDSVHGTYPGEVHLEGDVLHVDGKSVRMTENRDILANKWGEIGVAVCVSVWVALMVLLPDLGIITQIMTIASVMLFGAPLFYALSKIIWANFFFHYDPSKAIPNAASEER